MTSKVFCLLFVLESCNIPDQHKKVQQTSWEKIQIITRTQNISIEHYADSALFEENQNKASYFNGLAGSDTFTKTKFVLKSVERDSLYEYVFDLITNPTFTDRNATDYAGYVRVKLIDRNTTLTCEYKSVGEWSTVSPATANIYKLLKRKIPIADQ
jgi:hypothetical protein